jgi:hypothetical protein
MGHIGEIVDTKVNENVHNACSAAAKHRMCFLFM